MITRRRFVGNVAAGALTATLVHDAKAHNATPQFTVEGGTRQLFLDDVGIDEMRGVRQVVNPPKRHPDNPLLSPDTTWERGCQVYGTAYYDEQAKRFKLWYLTGPKDRGNRALKLSTHEWAPHTTMAAYAESTDGVDWVKPSLGIFSYDGDTQNNLLGIGKYNCEGISVLHDPADADPARPGMESGRVVLVQGV